jgi:ribosome-associated protein
MFGPGADRGVRGRPGGGLLQTDQIARKIVDILSERQAEDILLLDIRNSASFADYFVIASSQSPRQFESILEALEEGLEGDGVSPTGREGKPDSGWVLLDYGDIIIHLFATAERSFYDLEGLWHTATPVVRIQ